MTATKPLLAHGTTARATRIAGHPKGCLCDPCTTRAGRYKKHRRLAVHRNTWTPLADAAPTVATVRGLLEAGWTERQIEYTAGLTKNYIRRILGLDASTPPRAKLRAATVAAITAAATAERLNPRVPDEALVNNTGSLRRVQALAAGGWPQPELAARGLDDLGHVPDRSLIAAGRARAINAVYEQLWGTPGPSRSAAIRARSRGFAPAMAWECLDIDDPRAAPDAWRRSEGRRRAEDLVEDAEWLHDEHGLSWDAVAARLAVSRDTLHAYRSRIARARQEVPA